MLKSRTLPILAALAVAVPAVSLAAPAAAQSRVVVAHGPYGGGYVAGGQVARHPGGVHVSRGVMTRSGHGVRETRDTHWGDGAISQQVRRTYANGASATRTDSVVRHPDGSVSRNRARTGAAGNSQSGWSTIYRTDDGYARTRGAQTSNGRGYSSTRDVSAGDDTVTVDRSATTIPAAQ